MSRPMRESSSSCSFFITHNGAHTLAPAYSTETLSELYLRELHFVDICSLNMLVNRLVISYASIRLKASRRWLDGWRLARHRASKPHFCNFHSLEQAKFKGQTREQNLPDSSSDRSLFRTRQRQRQTNIDTEQLQWVRGVRFWTRIPNPDKGSISQNFFLACNNFLSWTQRASLPFATGNFWRNFRLHSDLQKQV